ncbi:hypothetical protein J7T55_011994 [Diaporthe amygdali]|uniref:uncharacterized protein n=1 Tax=Phomopsis amygdali TaxID=1214568 RepID=UPI0022FECDD4|nr:uncharacterized protein J7T55_011994 [Diaporthe amygdali]KAJ0123529.1 hypothetical protein J7T55_011994 [Diaporthe amygdali]
MCLDLSQLFDSIFRDNAALDRAKILLAGASLVTKSSCQHELALISLYDTPTILQSLRYDYHYRADLGILRVPRLDLLLFVPAGRIFHIPRLQSRLFSLGARGYWLPVLWPHSYVIGVKRGDSRWSANIMLGSDDYIWHFMDSAVEGELTFYRSQLLEILRSTFLPMEPDTSGQVRSTTEVLPLSWDS